MRYLAIGLFLALIASPAAADVPDGWHEVAFLPWGAGEEEVGLTAPAEDELQLGPYGLAVATDGRTAIVDRVNGRALVLAADGGVEREIVLPGRPGAAALTDDGRLAVADLTDDRLVRVFGVGGGQFRTPRWTLPPHRLVVVEGADGWQRVEGLNGFGLRLPLSQRAKEPRGLGEGTPSIEGKASCVAFRRGGALVLRFDGAEVVVSSDVWPGGSGMAPGAVSVLATDGDSALVLVESVAPSAGPITVERAVVVVDASGGIGPRVLLPEPGGLTIPDPVAASADGVVTLLWATDAGCSLLRADLGRGEGSR
jgi:hypothetical protein